MSRDWQSLIYNGIPLARAMQVAFRSLPDGRVSLDAPLAPNVNDKGTGFGGSIAALATLAGWVETQRQLDLAGLESAVEIVVQRGETTYLLPVSGAFSATARCPDESERERFLRIFRRKGTARLAVTVELCCEARVVARFSGEYVARRTDA
ncbi:thioesterase [Chitinimonas arctica]|uniref:Thioesterase n=1 Tax=Chitinimonas arctica TaxID=2594795 RepID=A0A516SK77_9NEIS|nr:YiiD C-terminal domain-containing protein [Chitinimonas arctica]QDQ28556.1 thioesterase [Chitinimonas arctica]